MGSVVNSTQGSGEEKRVVAILSRAEPAIHRQFMSMVAAIRRQWTPEYLMTMIRQGSLEPAMVVVQANAQRFASEVNNVFIGAGMSAADAATASFARLTVRKAAHPVAEHVIAFAFDQVNHKAVTAMKSASLRLVTGLTSGQRGAVKSALVQGVTVGMNPVSAARLLRGSIGLTETQQGYVNNFQTSLQAGNKSALDYVLRDKRYDPTIVGAADAGTVLTDEQIAAMTDRYANNWLNFRADTIARTESLSAVHAGNQQGWDQALVQAQSSPAAASISPQLEREWVTAEDERVRDSHAEMDGQVVGQDEPFVSGDGNELMYPGDPSAPPEEVIRCRCAVATTFADGSTDTQTADG